MHNSNLAQPLVEKKENDDVDLEQGGEEKSEPEPKFVLALNRSEPDTAFIDRLAKTQNRLEAAIAPVRRSRNRSLTGGFFFGFLTVATICTIYSNETNRSYDPDYNPGAGVVASLGLFAATIWFCMGGLIWWCRDRQDNLQDPHDPLIRTRIESVPNFNEDKTDAEITLGQLHVQAGSDHPLDLANKIEETKKSLETEKEYRTQQRHAFFMVAHPRVARNYSLGRLLTGGPGFENSPLISKESKDRHVILETIFELAGIDAHVKTPGVAGR